jgi:hypothetical protein
MLKLDKEKYLQIMKSQGLSAALTTLHNDTNVLEIESFEGQKGWQPELYEYLKEVRDFSRDLWNRRYEN